MKVWHCYSGTPHDGSLLVVAETRNKARSMACAAGLWIWSYPEVSAVRISPEFDVLATHARVIETNHELPRELKFYNDEDL
jgi:hypothetical protein